MISILRKISMACQWSTPSGKLAAKGLCSGFLFLLLGRQLRQAIVDILHFRDQDLTVEGASSGAQITPQSMQLFLKDIGVSLTIDAYPKRGG